MKQVIEKLFGFDFQKHSVRTEIFAGITTFLTMAYILAVNPSIFSALPEMPGGSVFTATALAAIIGTLVMAIYAKKPFAVAPGMGMNALFVFTVCLAMGYHWKIALTAFTTAICFALALFFSPLFLAIPGAATAPALIIVGVMMMPSLDSIRWDDYCKAIPAFLTIRL